ncbi:MAG: alpha/beta hydrolase [Hyphomicrobiaceae bacterium]|nr:alpha/beta hydrolase [Hyphomicrobiaceae bacterium]
MNGQGSGNGGTVAGTGPDRMFRLGDGRRIAYREYGSSAGHPVLALHGTPGSRLMYAIAGPPAARLGLRLVAPDRWGYGRTDPHPRPSLAAWAGDAAELADGLGLSRFSVVGISGGCPYAAATAAGLGTRVAAVALAVPVGPIAAGEPARRLGWLHRLAYRWVGSRPVATRLLFRLYRHLLSWAPSRAVPLVAVGQCRSDRELVRIPSIRDHLGETFRAGLEPGANGPVIDLKLFSEAWDMSPGDISARTRIWIGGDDRLVPLAAARELARKIPRAELTEISGQGHFWIARDYEQVLQWLASAGRQREVRP